VTESGETATAATNEQAPDVASDAALWATGWDDARWDQREMRSTAWNVEAVCSH
jgi:hypothetical protein